MLGSEYKDFVVLQSPPHRDFIIPAFVPSVTIARIAFPRYAVRRKLSSEISLANHEAKRWSSSGDHGRSSYRRELAMNRVLAAGGDGGVSADTRSSNPKNVCIKAAGTYCHVDINTCCKPNSQGRRCQSQEVVPLLLLLGQSADCGFQQRSGLCGCPKPSKS